jgi:hypothetical protein
VLKLATGDILVSLDHFGSGFSEAQNASVYRSRDNGTTWQHDGWVQSQYWANIFQLDPKSPDVYMIGTNDSRPSAAKISKSRDGGATWSAADSAIIATGTAGIYSTSGFETGPTPALLASDGVVYRAVELQPPPSQWPKTYQAVMLSANASSDLLQAANWRVSQPLPFDPSWLPASWGELTNPGYLEGNAVEGPNGEIYDVLRLNSMPVPGNKAILLQYNPTTGALTFRKALDLPGGHTKFVIHRDPVTKLYMTLSNNNTVLGNPLYFDQRNILTLCVSTDVENWTIVGTLLYDDTGLAPDDSVRYTGFHYVDWQIDGADLIYVIRTAYRGAESYHNSNRITFKRLVGFRSYLPGQHSGGATAVVTGTGFSIEALQDNSTAFSNRGYVWIDIPPSLLRQPALAFTMLAGGGNASLSVHVAAAGMLYVGTADLAMTIALETEGFMALDPTLMSMRYTDADATKLYLFAKSAKAGEAVVVPQGGWTGSIVIGDLRKE